MIEAGLIEPLCVISCGGSTPGGVTTHSLLENSQEVVRHWGGSGPLGGSPEPVARLAANPDERDAIFAAYSGMYRGGAGFARLFVSQPEAATQLILQAVEATTGSD